MKISFILRSALILVLSSLLIIFSSCEGINDMLGVDDNEEGVLSSDEYEISPFKTVEINFENVIIESKEIFGRIGGYDVTLNNIDEKLVFLVPQMPAGPTELEFDVNNTSYSLSFDIKPSVEIPNPEEYLSKFIDEQTTAVNNNASLIDEFISDDRREDYHAELENINQLFIDIESLLQTATNEEKIEAAQFIYANRDDIELLQTSVNEYISAVSSLNELKQTGVYDSESKFDVAYVKFVLARINLISQAKKIIVWTAGGALAGSWLPVIGTGIGAAMGAGIGIGNFFIALQADNIATEELTQFEAIVEDISVDLKKLNGNYYNNQKATLIVSGNYSNINSSFQNSTMTKIQEFISYLRTFRDLFNKINEKIPDIMSFKPKVIEDLNSVRKTTKQVNGKYLSISNITNTNVTYSHEIMDGEYLVTFSSDQETDQEFSFDINYSYNGFSEKSTVANASLVISEASLVGKWDVYYNQGITYGEWTYYYFEETCPDIISYAYKLHYQTLEFTETTLESNQRESSKNYTYYGIDYVSCTYDDFDVYEETVDDNEIVLYYVEDNVIKVSDGDVVVSYPIIELTANTLKMGYYEDGEMMELHMVRVQ